AFYRDSELVVNVSPLYIVDDGNAPEWVKEKVLRWAMLHHEELVSAWNRCYLRRPPSIITPMS
ncbi:MAG: hypothetical protein K9N48_03625, partial [Verrucomicrobia bacterium]|nr:hypothetical protein [Verrucomicrobiota bacterium]